MIAVMKQSAAARRTAEMRGQRGRSIFRRMEAMMSEDIPQSASCARGQHRARRVRLIFTEGLLRSRCRDCGCDLVRSQATRRWYYSGPLGAT